MGQCCQEMLIVWARTRRGPNCMFALMARIGHHGPTPTLAFRRC